MLDLVVCGHGRSLLFAETPRFLTLQVGPSVARTD